MRKLIWVAAAVAALAATGAALAHLNAGKGVTTVATTFTAKPTGATRTRTCTDASNAVWNITNGVYQGAATGDLAGNVTIRTQSVINTTTGNGFTDGKVLLRDAGTNRLIGEANLDAVNSHDGVLDGMLQGRVPGGRLIANFTATFANDGSSLSGSLGGGSGNNTAVVYGGMPKCVSAKTAPPKPILRLDGKVTAASGTSLSVQTRKSSYTVTVPSSLATAVSGLKAGDRVDLTAAYINGAYTLVTLRLHR
jgi:hypothetical protein